MSTHSNQTCEVDASTALTLSTLRSSHTCAVSEFGTKYLRRLFGTEDTYSRGAAEDMLQLGLMSACQHCADRYFLLSEALDYHVAALTSGDNQRRAEHYKLQRKETLREMGY